MCTSLIFAQNNEMVQSFQQGNYKKCIQLCELTLKENNSDATAHFLKGASLIKLKKYKDGLHDLKKAEALKFANTFALRSYLIQGFAGSQQTSLLLSKLEVFTQEGFSGLNVFAEQEFEYLTENDAFQNLKQKVEANAFPCRFEKAKQRLDFWVGDWEVYVGGVKSADSKISKSVDNCSLFEDYRTLSGFTGSSLSYYDQADNLYKQTWIDRTNSVIHFKEIESKKGYLLMEGEGSKSGKVRMSYTYDPKDDSVTQTFDTTTDDGKTWNNGFTGVYKRRLR